MSVKIETEDRTMDQMLFDIMEKKNKISMLITDIIKDYWPVFIIWMGLEKLIRNLK